jgi:alanine dehydrogenase
MNNATFPYLMGLANRGLEAACQRNGALREGANTYKGQVVVYQAIAESQGKKWKELRALV